jgi:DNA-binding NarL/FixJ family response regulator
MTERITILLADDHEMVRKGLRALLETKCGLAIVGESGDGLQALRLVVELKPDILVTDLMVSGLNGLEMARQIRSKSLQTRVIILTMHQELRYVGEALRNGAAGYVLKSASCTELVKAIHKVKTGDHYLSPALMSALAARDSCKKPKPTNWTPMRN